MNPNLPSACIDRLRLRGCGQDTPTLRLAVSSRLGGSELKPAAMPPSGLLIVRRLTTTIPPRWLLHPAPRPESAWERALDEQLTGLYRGAARPVFGPVPADAEAVWFADEAECLACLALDLDCGLHRQHWWWRSFLRELPPIGKPLPILLQRQVRQLPALLLHLTRRDQAIAVIGSLSADEAIAILENLVAEHELSRTLSLRAEQQSLPRPDRLPPAPRSPAIESVVRAVESPAPPWRRWLPTDKARTLTPEQECLLGTGLALHYAPSRTRSSLFAAQVQSWWRSRQVSAGQEIFTTIQTPSEQPPSATASRAASPEPSDLKHATRLATEAEPSPAEVSSSRSHQQQPDAASSAPVIAANSTAPEPVDHALQDADKASSNLWPQAEPTTDTIAFQSSFEQHKSPAHDPTVPAIHEYLSEGVPTRLGGVLYLINLLEALDLPDCFEPDWQLDSRLGGWGLLEILAQALLGPHFAAFTEDAIWTALAELDGRATGEPPGHDFVGCDAFRLPQAWFQAVRDEETVLYWAAQGQRLQLWSNAAYVLVDVPRGKRLSAELQVRNEADRYCRSARLLHSVGEVAPLAPLYPPLNTRLGPSLVRWLKPALPCIERRLRLALFPAADLVDELLTVSGHLYVSATHVDLVSDLESISIAVRKAGLDRNPGWVTGLGRVVSFHFD